MSGENPFKGLKLKPTQEKEEIKEQSNLARRAVAKPKMYLESAGITDYSYEEKEDGVHYILNMSPEDMREKQEQAKTVLNAPDPTHFEKEKMLPFIKLISKDKKLAYRILDRKDVLQNYVEIVIFNSSK